MKAGAVLLLLAFLVSMRVESAFADAAPLRLVGITLNEDQTVSLFATGEPGEMFVIEVSWDGETWRTLEEPSAMDGAYLVRFYTFDEQGNASINDPTSPLDLRFYRLYYLEVLAESSDVSATEGAR